MEFGGERRDSVDSPQDSPLREYQSMMATILRASSGFGNDAAEPLNWGFLL